MYDFNDDPAPPPGAGHNKPPPDSDWMEAIHPAVVREQLDLDYAGLTKRRDDLMAGFKRFEEQVPEITSDALEAKVTEFLGQLTALRQELERSRKTEKEVFDNAAGAVQRWFKSDHLDPIDDCSKKVNARLTAYKVKKVEAEKLRTKAALGTAQAEAKRTVAQAERSNRPEDKTDAELALGQLDRAARNAAASPTQVARARTAGASSGLRTTYLFEVTDFAALPDRYKLLNEQLLRAELKDAPRGDDGAPVLNIPGVRVVADYSSTVRT